MKKTASTHKSLRQMKALLAEVQGLAKLGIFEIDFRDGSILWSDELYRRYGYEKEEFTPTLEKVFEHVHPDDRDRVREAIEVFRQADSEEVLTIEYRMFSKDEDVVYIHAIFTPGKDKTGQTVRCRCVSQDITEKILKQQDLDKEKFKVQRYFNISGAILVALNIRGEVLMINKGGRELLGYDEDEIIGMNWFDLCIPESNRREVQSRFDQAMLKDDKIVIEYYENKIITKPGKELTIIWHNLLDYDEQGNIIGTYSSGINITERKQVEGQLRESEKQLLEAQRMANVGNWNWDVSTDTVRWSDEVYRIYGLSRDDEPVLTRERIKAFMHPDDLDRIYRNIDRTVELGTGNNNEYRIVRPDGSVRTVSSRREVRLDKERNVIGLRGTVHDITERKQVEEELHKHQQIEYVVSELLSSYFKEQNLKASFDGMLSTVLELTESEYGFIGEVLFDKEDSPYLKTYVLTNIAWNDETRRFYDENAPDGLEFRNLKTLFGAVMTSKEVVISNDRINDPRSGGIPEGHPSLDTFLGIPIIHDEKLIGMLAMANRPGGYDEEITKSLSPVISACTSVITYINARNTLNQREAELRNKDNDYRTLFETSREGITSVDLEGHIEMCNDAYCNMLGYSLDELMKLTYKQLTPGKWHAMEAEILEEKVMKEGYSGEYEKEYARKDGTVFPVAVRAWLVNDDEGNPKQLIGLISDITERKQIEDRAISLGEIIEQSLNEIYIFDADDLKFLEVNAGARNNLDYSMAELSMMTPVDIQPEHSAESFNELVEPLRTDAKEEVVFQTTHRRKDATLYPVEVHLQISSYRSQPAFIAFVLDITERKQAEEKLSFQASHDALTGLVNRREFERRAERLLSTIRQDQDEHALCYMDLDQFKVVNDTCGHHAGDELLRQLGTILQDTVRKRDTLARLGGDEFGVLMEHCSLKQARRVARSLQKAIQDYQFTWEGQSFRVGVSMGLVAITEATPSLTELMQQADAACYMAKDKGRNRIHVHHADDSELAQRHGEMQWVTRIQQALEEKRFCLYAQAIVPLDNSQDTHYELLVRMVDEKGTLIPPGAFLPAAERYNLIVDIDRWVIEQAITLLTQNPVFQQQIQFISINLSGLSLTTPGVLNFITRQLADSGIEAHKLCFEITETAAIANLSTASTFIATLKELGCRFALDDFGSGLSSFAYLKNLPVDYLKIDGMFVKDIVDDPIDHAMVKSINEIGHVMGMQTIAEFVENDEIKGMLREIGVNYAQGYGVGKPQPFDELLGKSTNVTDINKSEKDEYDL
ncbi:MAG: diguanylate cyclase (GGDEF)-like protein/PAS domain S-box-containing protein [Gammaproteobacteria bacterium]